MAFREDHLALNISWSFPRETLCSEGAIWAGLAQDSKQFWWWINRMESSVFWWYPFSQIIKFKIFQMSPPINWCVTLQVLCRFLVGLALLQVQDRSAEPRLSIRLLARSQASFTRLETGSTEEPSTVGNKVQDDSNFHGHEEGNCPHQT
jgi:hypothetical protein